MERETLTIPLTIPLQRVTTIWRFPARKMGVPLYRWLVYFMEHPIQIG